MSMPAAQEIFEIATVVFASGIAIAVAWISERVTQIERSRARAAASPELARIWASVAFTEARAAAEQTLMDAIGPAPVKLYRREGRRYIPWEPNA